MTSDGARGLYGFRLDGITPSVQLLVEVVSHAPTMKVAVLSEGEAIPTGFPQPTEDLVDGARMGVDTERQHAVYCFPHRPSDDDMVHPWLVPAVSELAVSTGRFVLHGGVLSRRGRALAVIADREGGKSSLLAYAAASGGAFSVLADDLIVLDGTVVQAGPRCIDLRLSTLPGLPELSLIPSRFGSRYRLVLPPCAPVAELVGFVYLRWADSLRLASIPATERLTEMIPHMSSSTQGDALARLLGLAELPAWRLSRPRDWSAMGDSLQLLAGALEA